MTNSNMPNGKVLPAVMSENKPRIHAIRYHNDRPDRLPDGMHCGAWLDPDTHEVWKCLYGRPYVNASVIVRTDEDIFLAKFAKEPCFPQNWCVESSNGLEWLVRKEAIQLTPDDYKRLENDEILEIEQCIRRVNMAGWAFNDYITLLVDKDTHHLFIGDCSTVCRNTQADDWYQIERFMRLCDREQLINLRSQARTVLHDFHYGKYVKTAYAEVLKEWMHEQAVQYKHVYASFNRPISRLWADLPEDVCLKHEKVSVRGQGIPWTWIITKEPLSDDCIKSYELAWGWSVLHKNG